MLGDYIRLAVSNISRRRLRSWLTLIGIVIGITSVVALIGLGEGLRETVNAQFGFLGKDILTVTASGGFGPPGTGTVEPLTRDELEAIRSIDGVKGVGARNLASTDIRYNDVVMFQFIGSLPPGDDRDVVVDGLSLEVERGRMLEDGDQRSIIVGSNYRESTNVFGKAVRVGRTIALNDQDFEVIGILKKSSNLQLNGLLLINEDDFETITDHDSDVVDLIQVQVHETAEISVVESEIERELRKIRDVDEGEENFSVRTPESLLEQVNSLILGIQIFIYLIAGISVLVGGIGIMNTMYTSVLERTKEIGVMKSVGGTNSSIFILFFIESGGLGLIGGAIGVLFGSLASLGLSVVAQQALGTDLLSVQLTPFLLGGALFFSFIIGSLFGTLPALQASRLQPVDALRYSK